MMEINANIKKSAQQIFDNITKTEAPIIKAVEKKIHEFVQPNQVVSKMKDLLRTNFNK